MSEEAAKFVGGTLIALNPVGAAIAGVVLAVTVVGVFTLNSFFQKKENVEKLSRSSSIVNELYEENEKLLKEMEEKLSRDNLSNDDRNELNVMYKRRQKVKEFFLAAQNCLKTDKNQFNIGIVGERGTGKSTLINVILGEKVAKVGQTETTMNITPYQIQISGNNKLKVWDTPGWGTQSFPYEEYSKALIFFDYVVIVVGMKIDERDIELYQKLTKEGIPVAFVRSKSDIDVNNEAWDNYGNAYTELETSRQQEVANKTYNKVKENFSYEISKANIQNGTFYYISARLLRAQNKELVTFDNNKFYEDFIEGVCKCKKEKINRILRG